MISILGYGLFPHRDVTLAALAKLEISEKIFLVRATSGIDAFLRTHGINYSDLTALYAYGEQRDRIYRSIADTVIEAARGGEPVCYLTYGHPSVFDDPVRLIESRSRKLGLECEILPGLSFVDVLLARLRIPVSVAGFQVVEASHAQAYPQSLSPSGLVLIAQTGAIGHNSALGLVTRTSHDLADLQNALLTVYDGAHPVYLCDASPDKPEIVVCEISVGELAASADLLSYTCTLCIPPIFSSTLR